MSASKPILLEDIIEKLHFTKSFISINILPSVKHSIQKNGQIKLDGAEFRQWLMENSSFTRQTKFVPAAEASNYRKILMMHKLPTECPSVYQRTTLPHRVVNPFDYFDKNLIFPDDPRFGPSMTFQRVMYSSAAVKIKISEKHILYYAPALENVLSMKNGKFLYKKAEAPSSCMDISSNTGKEEKIESPILLPALDTDVFNAVNYKATSLRPVKDIVPSIYEDKKPKIEAFSNEALFSAFIDTLQNMGMSLKDIKKSFDASMEQRMTR